MAPNLERGGPDAVIDQVAAGIAQAFNSARVASRGVALDGQLAAFENALVEVANVEGFLRDPGGQLGNPLTKHGEIAEVLEVGIRRAHDCIDQVAMSAHMDGVARTGPVDFVLNGVDAQSKFINGTSAGLRAVLGHASENAGFLDGGGVYVIPSDQYELVGRVLQGDVEGISTKTVHAIERQAQEIRDLTGRPPLEVLKPSISTYSEVQPGNIERTMDRHGRELEEHNQRRNEQIDVDHQASLQEGLKATAAAAAVGATVGFAAAAFKKYREGKNVFAGDFDAQDWRDVGGQAATGAMGGALSGGAVYLMTNCADLSAPLAGAFVSAAKGLHPLVASYARGEMTGSEFVDAGLFVCSDVALIGIATAAGQALLPVPLLGAMIGSLAGKCLASFLESQLRGASDAIQERLASCLSHLDASQRVLVNSMVAKYDGLGNLATRAFDLQANLSLLALSVEVAEAHGVPAHLLLRTEEDVDNFMSS